VAIDGRLKRSQEQPSECSLIRTDTSDGRRLAGLEEELQHAEHNHVLRVHGEKYTKTTREGNTQKDAGTNFGDFHASFDFAGS
jgi:hypothetical protein